MLDRWISIIDLCDAAKILEKKIDKKIIVTAYASIVPPEAVNQLLEKENLQILPAPTHEELPSLLKGADILFLPETFDKKQCKRNSFVDFNKSTFLHDESEACFDICTP
jgi:hypothetical protein